MSFASWLTFSLFSIISIISTTCSLCSHYLWKINRSRRCHIIAFSSTHHITLKLRVLIIDDSTYSSYSMSRACNWHCTISHIIWIVLLIVRWCSTSFNFCQILLLVCLIVKLATHFWFIIRTHSLYLQLFMLRWCCICISYSLQWWHFASYWTFYVSVCIVVHYFYLCCFY